MVTILILVDGFLQFERWQTSGRHDYGHNPYFSRWFSAIHHTVRANPIIRNVTILILVDGFLQYVVDDLLEIVTRQSQSLF